MTKFMLTLLLLSATLVSFAQHTFNRNDVYLEALGNGFFGSVNYERQLTKAPGLGMRVGVGFYSQKAFYLTIPVGINYLFPLKNEHAFLDAGLGATYTARNNNFFGKNKVLNDDPYISFIPSIGYRRHTAGDVMWRVSITPVINDRTFVPWIGVAIGKRF